VLTTLVCFSRRSSAPRVVGEDTGNGRIEIEGFDPDIREACPGEEVLEFVRGSDRGVAGGARAAGLAGERDSSSWAEQAA
jgi:hypothetical protein